MPVVLRHQRQDSSRKQHAPHPAGCIRLVLGPFWACGRGRLCLRACVSVVVSTLFGSEILQSNLHVQSCNGDGVRGGKG